MGGLLWIPLIVPLAVAAGCGLVVAPTGRRAVGSRALRRAAGVTVSGSILLTGLALVGATSAGDTPSSAGGLLRADALSAYLLTVVGAVGLTATWGGFWEPAGRAYATLVSLFLGAMSLAVLADNLGVLWVAVEATTIATAFLVGHHGTRRSLEAAWKYVILGSVGVAIAFLGLVLLYAATRAAGEPTLSWVVLQRNRIPLDPALVRVAVALAALGLATKAGLAPMHSWLPDAHSQAPAPVSGLMSGVLLAVAFYGILRIQAISDAVVGPALMRGLLTVAGLLSLAVAAALILRQRDYKRMLAYSSIEHMGLLALGAAVGGPLALAAVLLHVLGHGLAKAGLFVVAGRILRVEGSASIADVRGLLARRPGLAVPFLAGMAALLGFPPFILFFSEVGILIAGWRAGMGWVMAIALVLLLIVFGGLVRLATAMTFGKSALADSSWQGTRLPLILALGASAVAGFAGTPVGPILQHAVAALGGQ